MAASSLCLHVAVPPWAHPDTSPRGETRQIGLVPSPMASFTLSTSLKAPEEVTF